MPWQPQSHSGRTEWCRRVPHPWRASRLLSERRGRCRTYCQGDPRRHHSGPRRCASRAGDIVKVVVTRWYTGSARRRDHRTGGGGWVRRHTLLQWIQTYGSIPLLWSLSKLSSVLCFGGTMSTLVILPVNRRKNYHHATQGKSDVIPAILNHIVLALDWLVCIIYFFSISICNEHKKFRSKITSGSLTCPLITHPYHTLAHKMHTSLNTVYIQ